MTHLKLFTLDVEIDWFTTLGMANLVQDGCLSSIGVADDQNPKVLDALVEY